MTSSPNSPFLPWPEPTVFADIPVLPVVPLPQAEEDLASWLQAVAETYGMSLSAYLAHLGFPRVRDGSSLANELILNPSAKLLTRLHANTGIDLSRLAAMTFLGLDQDLAAAALNHDASCASCTAAAIARAGRPVRLLGARAVWRVVCPVHPPFPRPEEVSSEVDLRPVYARIQEILAILDRAAFDPKVLEAYMPVLHPAVTAGTAVHFAFLLNSFLQVRLETYDTLRDLAVFQVLRTFEPVQRGRPTPLPVAMRNDRALSLLLAWQLLSLPGWGLLIGLRLRTSPGDGELDQCTAARAVFDLLLEVWPGELIGEFILDHRRSKTVATSGPQRLTTTAVQLTTAYGNQPDAEALRATASEQHSAFVRHIFARAVAREPDAMYSAFEDGGPFRYRVPPTHGKTAATVVLIRRKAWKHRGWKRHLQKLRSSPPAHMGPAAGSPPLKLMSPDTVKAVVESAMMQVGLPASLDAKARRRHWHKLVRVGRNELQRAQLGGLLAEQGPATAGLIVAMSDTDIPPET